MPASLTPVVTSLVTSLEESGSITTHGTRPAHSQDGQHRSDCAGHWYLYRHGKTAMAWTGTGRTRASGSTLPLDWQRLRRLVLDRDGRRCTHKNDEGRRCDAPANQVDHIDRRAGDTAHNLQSLCEWHHRNKSAREGAQAKHQARQAAPARYSERRRHERHPGLRTTGG